MSSLLAMSVPNNFNSCNTLAFFDLETTGLPAYHSPRITELSFCTIERSQFRDATPGIIPRVTNRLNLCIYPSRLVDPEATNKTKLDNYNLEHQGKFDDDVFNNIYSFLNRLKKPICLIAHNGFKFDFPILQAEMAKLGKELPEDILCADSLLIFRSLQKPFTNTNFPVEIIRKETDCRVAASPDFAHPFQLINEKTPEKRKNDSSDNCMGSHRPYKRSLAFRLDDVYERYYGVKPKISHEAEADVQALLLSAIAIPVEFLHALDNNAVLLSAVKKCW